MTSSISRSSSAVVSSAGRLFSRPAELTSPPISPSRSTTWSNASAISSSSVTSAPMKIAFSSAKARLGRGERGLVGIEHGDRPAIVEQPFGDRQADARCTAGDDRRMLHLMRSRIET